MKPNQAYFYRNRGPWDWRVVFVFKNWRSFWKSNIPLFSKFSLSVLGLIQQIFGPLRMWTKVDFEEAANVVYHTTKMKKCGLTIYRSEKKFILHEDGHGLQLEGSEYYWPLGFLAFPFKTKRGFVEKSTTRASYQMPIAGSECDCTAVLEPPTGHIDIATPWFEGSFTLTEESNRRLASRFE